MDQDTTTTPERQDHPQHAELKEHFAQAGIALTPEWVNVLLLLLDFARNVYDSRRADAPPSAQQRPTSTWP